MIPLKLRKLLGNYWYQKGIARKKRALLQQLRGNKVECNLCHWQGERFADDPWHPGTLCPNCGSQVRHRMLVALLDGESSFLELRESALLQGKKVLHFAPERQLRDRIQKASGSYVSTDYDRGDVDLKLNMSEMPSLEDASFDVVIACDVLEHVPDDAAAMRELSRILKPNGIALITVPQKDTPSKTDDGTDEDCSMMTPEECHERFGQKDHRRMYGDDLAERLEAAPFSVTVLDASQFTSKVIERFVLRPPTLSAHPLATNQRRFYVARKPSSFAKESSQGRLFSNR